MTSDFRLDTERLILRHMLERDLSAFIAYSSDPIVTQFDSVRDTDEEAVLAFFREQQRLSPGEPGRWLQVAVELRETGELVGDLGFRVSADEPYMAELGYRLAPAHHGKGLATEAVRRLLAFAFRDLGLHRIIAIVNVENVRSIALLERVGFRREGMTLQSYPYKDGWADEYLYALLEREWRRLSS